MPGLVPRSVWVIPTAQYVGFIAKNVNRFCLGFEYVYNETRDKSFGWEQTKIMAMFLRCIQYTVGENTIHREPALWWSRHVGRRTWYGLGFETTLPKYGYCWIEPRIDWQKMVFKPRYTDSMLFGNRILGSRYNIHGPQLNEFSAASKRIEHCVRLMVVHRELEPVMKLLRQIIVHSILAQFRSDVLQNLRKFVREQHLDHVDRADRGLSYDYITKVVNQSVVPVTGNRMGGTVRDVHAFVKHLFLEHKHEEAWSRRPYRILYGFVRETLSEHYHLRYETNAIETLLWRVLFTYHWILPYPSKIAFLQNNKKGARMWYSIVTRDEGGKIEYRWASTFRTGEPRALPDYARWSSEDIQAAIEQMTGQSG